MTFVFCNDIIHSRWRRKTAEAIVSESPLTGRDPEPPGQVEGFEKKLKKGVDKGYIK